MAYRQTGMIDCTWGGRHSEKDNVRQIIGPISHQVVTGRPSQGASNPGGAVGPETKISHQLTSGKNQEEAATQCRRVSETNA
jgi:hypothetical protein